MSTTTIETPARNSGRAAGKTKLDLPPVTPAETPASDTNGNAAPAIQNDVATKKYRMVMVEDHPIMREGMKGRINSENDFVVCGEAESAQGGLQLIEKLKPDLLLLDLSLEESSGLDLLKDLKIQFPGLRVLIFSMHDETLYAERALRAGAHGYIMKGESPEKVIQAMRQVLNGEVYLSDSMTRMALARMGGGKHNTFTIEDLSDRELEVFQYIGRGYGTREIAAALHLSVKTIASHREHIKVKLNLKSSSALVQHAIHWAQGK